MPLRAGSCLFLALSIWLPSPGAAASPRIYAPDPDRRTVLDTVEIPEDLELVAVDRGGARAALTIHLDRGKKKEPATAMLLYGPDATEPDSLEFPGRIRDLIFSEDGSRLYALQHRPAKKTEGTTYLLSVDLATRRAQREMRVPPSARGIDYWPAERSLLVASRNEIRTILLPGLRSGPLFRVLGENLCLATAGPSLVVVGQHSGILTVNLYDPPGREQMPVRQRIATAAPVAGLALASDGTRALARFDDGRVFDVSLDPLQMEEVGSGLLWDRPRADAANAPTAGPPALSARSTPTESAEQRLEQPTLPTTEPADEPVAQPPAPAARPLMVPPAAEPHPEPSTPPTQRMVAAPAEKPVEQPPAPPAREPADEPAGRQPPSEPDPPSSRPAPEPAPTVDAPLADPQIRGRIVGEGLHQVAAVVLFGPNNILREASRVRPHPDGRWEIRGLEPGRYRVQLDGGGDRVLVSEPRFLVLEVIEDMPPVEAEFRLLRSL